MHTPSSLFLCSPNNPTGNSFSPEAIGRLAEGFPASRWSTRLTSISPLQPSSLNLLDQYPRLVVMQTFLKPGGWRVSAWAGTSLRRKSLSCSIRVKPPIQCQPAHPGEAVKATGRITNNSSNGCSKASWGSAPAGAVPQRTGLQSASTPPTPNFLLVKVAEPRRIYDFLVERGIIVRDRSRVALLTKAACA